MSQARSTVARRGTQGDAGARPGRPAIIWPHRDGRPSAARSQRNDEVIDLGGNEVRWLDTARTCRHNWNAGLI